MKNTIFAQFTNLYSLTKTLRFELKPVGKTEEMLKKYRVFDNDEKIAKNYKEAKKWFDKLHREFIDDSLNSLELDLELLRNYEQNYKQSELKINKKQNEIANKLRKQIKKHFKKVAEAWRDNYLKQIENSKLRKKIVKLKGLDILFKVEVFGLLKQKYPQAVIDEHSVFDTFNKFSTYFRGFHESRKNLYKDDGTSTAISTRIIDVNLPKFLTNKKKFDDKYKSNPEVLSFLEKDGINIEIFNLNYFNKCLTQDQIDFYNEQIGKINTILNRFRQQKKKSDYPLFDVLFNQILGEKNNKGENDFIKITNDNEVFSAWRKFIQESEIYFPPLNKLFSKLFEDKERIFDLNKIYVGGRFLNTISNKWLCDWNALRRLFLNSKRKKLSDFVSLEEIKEKLAEAQQLYDKKDFFRDKYKEIYEQTNDFFEIFIRIWQKEWREAFLQYKSELKNAQNWLGENKVYTNKQGKLRNGKSGEQEKEVIRLYAETALSVYQMIKYFALEKNKQKVVDKETDPLFYNKFNENYESLHTWMYFNELRNYLTKKPYSEEKIKLNFKDATLLDGWDINKEKDNYGIILRKDNKYFLGIMRPSSNYIFNKRCKEQMKQGLENGFYEKMYYKQIADPKRDFPKGVFSRKGKETFKPSKEIVEIYQTESFKTTSDRFSLVDLHKLIDFYKECIKKHPSWSMFDFAKVKPTKEYKNIGEFFDDLAKNKYKVWFEAISKEYIDSKIKNEELFLFEIYNKDFSPQADGTKNLHTLYWQELFSEQNLKEPIFKLNGGAEIFYRPASLPVEEEQRKFKRPIIKYKRYTEDKIFFHCPITLNFTQESCNKKEFNQLIGKIIVGDKNSKINIIGIDRGEEHLVYYSLINQDGNILKIGSLNIINNFNYQKKLDELEKTRDRERKEWQILSRIKDLKKGYISQVVKQIADLAVAYNAIIVFEDLNVGFKRGRFAIEKQVYQNLELALAQKLNYLAFKKAKFGELGHIRQAYQLTPEVKNFQDIGKQCGIIFYIPAAYTSAICPVCGFRKNIPTPIENLEKNQEFVKMFDVVYEEDKDRFRFEYEYQNNSYTFYSNVERYQYRRTKDNRRGEIVFKDPNVELKKLFEKNGIDLESDIPSQIFDKDLTNEGFYKPFIYNIRLILQLRNTVREFDDNKAEIRRDFIECPACHFHSEKNLGELKKRYKGKGVLEFNGDANGAYNIARKGIILLNKIKNSFHSENMNWDDFRVTQEDWDEFVVS